MLVLTSGECEILHAPHTDFCSNCGDRVLTAEGTFWTMVMQPSGMTLLVVMMGAAGAGKRRAGRQSGT
jgi:molybdenum cofactor biosynthesis enzyme MoaA